ncbi:MAG: response regulator [Nitrososphaeraceae archaeon]
MPRILLVDDDKDHLMLFTMVLEDGGYSVDAYTDPIAVLLRFRPDYYDVAILDYIMPVLNGLELYRRIREIDPRIRCSILTANHEKFSEYEDKPQGQRNLRIIRKPIGNEELLMNIREQVPIKSFRYTTISDICLAKR